MRIVICDDHRLLLEALTSALAARGYAVEAATSTPPDALRAVRLHDPDVLIMDLGFPNANGLDAVQVVREEHPRTKVVVLTGSDEREPLRRALELGVSGYIRKDQKVSGIIAVLEGVHNGDSTFDHTLVKALARGTPVPAPRRTLDDLTPREWDIARLLQQGLSTTQIVERLGVSQSTVRTHVHTILSKLQVHSRLQAAALLADLETAPGPTRQRGSSDVD